MHADPSMEVHGSALGERAGHAREGARLRILIVSFVFPPHNVIGAVRVGKTAKYLWRMDQDVRVLTARDIGEPSTLALEIPDSAVVYTRWSDVDAPFRFVMRLRASAVARLRSLGRGRGARGSARRPREDERSRANDRPSTDPRGVGWYVRRTYADLIHVPDPAIGWYSHGVRAGHALIAQWRPDVILASGAPWTSFLIARELASEAGVPWVADLRDPWAGNPDLIGSQFRKRFVDPWLERRVLASAAALVTVTEPIAVLLRRRYADKPVHVVLNGYDPEDYAIAGSCSPANGIQLVESRAGSPRPAVDPTLRLVYTGQMYRDLTPLLDALALLGSDLASVRVEVIGVTDEGLRARYSAAAAAREVGEALVWLPPVPHRDALDRQQSADVLFVLVHDTPYDAGIYTGKLLEYVAARRPILVVGTETGLAAELVCGRGLGAAEREPERIADRIRAWLMEKRAVGRIAGPPGSALDEFSRETQTRVFANILRRVVERR